MNTSIAQWLQAALPTRADLVIHLGATPGQWPLLPPEQRPQRLVLVQGDPGLAAELRAEVAAGLSAQVIEAIVAPQAGSAVWHRCNLPALGGLLPPAALANVFPRLRVLEAQTVQARALADLLGEVETGTGEHRVLLVDQPGLEAALLRALPPAALRGFDWVLLRGARAGLYDGGERLADAVRALDAQHLMTVREDSQSDPLWPVLLLRHDHVAAERDELRAEHLALREALRDAQAALAECVRERDAARRAEQKLTERSGQLERSEQAREAAEKLAADRGVALKAAQDQARAAAAERSAELKTAQEQLRRLHELEAELADGAARQHILQEELLKAEGQIDLIKELLLREPAA
jgi:hypothetical protein